MRNKIKGKKGVGIGSPLIDFWAFIIFVFALLFFVLLFNLKGGEIKNYIKDESGSFDVQLSFLNFLRAPVDDSRSYVRNVADLAVIGAKEKDLNSFEEKYEELFAQFMNNNFKDCCYEISIFRNTLRVYYKKSCSISGRLQGKKRISALLPSPYTESLNVTFTYYTSLRGVRRLCEPILEG